MKFRPSAVEEFIATLPEDLQIVALEAVIKERKRHEEGLWTEEEKKIIECARALAKGACKIVERTASEVFRGIG